MYKFIHYRDLVVALFLIIIFIALFPASISSVSF